MMDDLRAQAEGFGAVVQERDVTSLDLSSRPFRLDVGGETVMTRSLIIATGAQAQWLDAEGEATVRGRGVSTCATCDGALFQGEDVVVVGGGDAAMEEAIFLTRFARKVTVLHRRDTFVASRVMLARAEAHPDIEIRPFSQVKRWLSDDSGFVPQLRGALVEDPRDGSTCEISFTGAFVAIGHKPLTSFLAGQLMLDEEGYVMHELNTMTSVPGVFAAGDVVDRRYRQAITAAAMGCQAAMDAERWLQDTAV